LFIFNHWHDHSASNLLLAGSGAANASSSCNVPSARSPQNVHTTNARLFTSRSHSSSKASLAYSTARTRWSKIVVAAVADAEESLARDLKDTEDGKDVVNGLKSLLSNLEDNARLMPIPDDGASDIEDFNAELDHLGPITWHDSPWLYCECYMYLLIQTCFSRRQTPFWKTYDVFARQKTGALKSSKTVIAELVQWFLEIKNKTHEDEVKGKENLKP
jgi:damage-control phosphatase, subfamily III